MSVSELHNHDSAFSFLLETYRQFQGHLIDSDYRKRLSAAASLSDTKARKKVIALSEEERDLRLRKLAAQVVAFSAAYDHSHSSAEQEVGVTPRAVVHDSQSPSLGFVYQAGRKTNPVVHDRQAGIVFDGRKADDDLLRTGEEPMHATIEPDDPKILRILPLAKRAGHFLVDPFAMKKLWGFSLAAEARKFRIRPRDYALLADVANANTPPITHTAPTIGGK